MKSRNVIGLGIAGLMLSTGALADAPTEARVIEEIVVTAPYPAHLLMEEIVVTAKHPDASTEAATATAAGIEALRKDIESAFGVAREAAFESEIKLTL